MSSLVCKAATYCCRAVPSVIQRFLVILCTYVYRIDWIELCYVERIVCYIRRILYGFTLALWRWTVGWGTALQAGRSRVRFPMVSLESFIDIILPAALWALGLTQPLTEMSTGNIYWGGKGGRCVGLTTLPHSCADCLEIWEPQRTGNLRACPGL